MNKALNRTTSRIICALICLALTIAVIASVGTVGFYAHAADDTTAFQPVAMNPTNNQFATVSGSAPKTPDGWTGGGIDGKGTGNAIGGVMELDSYANNKDNFKLSEDYPDEFPGNTSPDSPFGTGNYEGTNRNVLFINVRPDTGSNGTAYGYTSSSVSLSTNRFYKISAWVRTGNFTQGSGAAIRINGLGEDIAFNNINTLKNYSGDVADSWTSANDYYWEEYTFFIASSSFESQSATISLQVGDSYTDDKNTVYKPATGYALFDNIEVYEIAPATFYKAQTDSDDSEHILFKNLSAQTDDDIEAQLTNLGFYKNGEPSISGWQSVSIGTDPASLPIGVYNANDTFDEDNVYNLTADPLSANGKYTGGDSSILIISSYRDGSFRDIAAGLATEKFTVKRHHYYRISAWVKTQDVSGGSGATLAVSVIRNESDKEYEGKNLFGTVTSCTGDSSNTARGGYSMYSIYLKGSVYRDYNASVECWLGTDGNESRGIAMFDNVTVEEIMPSVYGSASGTSFDIDTATGVDGSSFRTFTDTGISNGSFLQIADYDDFDYPLSPADWTFHTPDTAGTAGYSTDMTNIDTDSIISGIIPTDSATYDEYYHKFGYGIVNPQKGMGSMLMMYSEKLSAFCYRSPNFTVTADTPGKLTVNLWADKLEGYGASLVLKNDNRVIATIEKIKDTNGFKDYTFYIEPNTADITTLSLEIWLGNSDRQSNNSKRSAGHMYVKTVSYAAIGDDTASDGTTVTKSAATKFAEYKATYEASKRNGDSEIGQVAYSFKTIDFAAFDEYDSSFVKYPYDWDLAVNAGDSDTVRYGIFDPSGAGKDSTVVDSFKNSNGGSGNGILMLENTTSAASTLSYNGSIVLNADTYYKVEVSVRVAFSDDEIKNTNSVGANISLTGTKFAFENIKDTSVKPANYDSEDENFKDTTVNNEAFRTYTFYIYPGSTEATVSLAISLGDATSSSKWACGRVYVNSITYTDITNIAYDEAVKNNADYTLIADISTPEEDSATDDADTSSETKPTLEWWLIPSILFAVVIVVAIVGFIIRKALEKRATKKGVVEKTSSYDRKATLNLEHNKNTEDKEEKVTEVIEIGSGDERYESFDDDAVTAPAKKAAETEEQPAAEQAEQATESSEEQAEKPEETAGQAAESTENAENTESTESGEISAETEKGSEGEEQPASPATEEPSEIKKDESYIDRFDD